MEETTVLLKRLQEGDKSAREVLIENNLGLVHHITKRFLGRGVDPEDLFQIGTIGLMKAIDKFDLNYQVKFSTYAVPLISGEIKRFLRDDGLVKVSRTLKEKGFRISQVSEGVRQRTGREPTLSEIMEETGYTEDEILLALEANVQVESIYKSVYQSDGSEVYLVDQVIEGQRASVGTAMNQTKEQGHFHEDQEKDKLINHLLLEQLLETLNEKEKQLIQLRYFENKTQMQVAKLWNMSQVQVSRMEKKILIGMRKQAGN